MNKVKGYNNTTTIYGDVSIMKKKEGYKTKMSTKGQVVIPKQIREHIDTTNFIVKYENDIIQFIPVREEDKFFDFTADIVKELVDDGYIGDNLRNELVKRKEMINKAFEVWIDDVEKNDDQLIPTKVIKDKRKHE